MVFSVHTETRRGHGFIKFTMKDVNLGGKLGGDVTQDSNVVVSITEIVVNPPGHGEFPHYGAARMSVLNVVPAENIRNQVQVRIFIGWESDLDYRITIFVDP